MSLKLNCRQKSHNSPNLILSKPDPISERIMNSPQYSNNVFRNHGENINFSLGTTISSMWNFIFKDQNTKEKGLRKIK